jgi:hypothetical protein
MELIVVHWADDLQCIREQGGDRLAASGDGQSSNTVAIESAFSARRR